MGRARKKVLLQLRNVDFQLRVLGQLGSAKWNRCSTTYWIVTKMLIYCCKLVALFHSYLCVYVLKLA